MSHFESYTAALSSQDIVELTAWRREIHRNPELSGEEEKTARFVFEMLEKNGPAKIITGLGGHGVAAIYDSGFPGPRILLRC
jgi:metal-dependent amidase/aminoacylase/carboxypeptidase family protein